MSGAVVGADGVPRCPWAGGDPLNTTYHDTEWGVRVVGEAAHFERLTLEAFQSGLSWLTILRKRPAFREAFAGFDPDVVAAFDEADRARLLADAGIVRNRLKIDAAITNAAAVVRLRERGGLEDLLRSFVPDHHPAPATGADVAAVTPESTAMSKTLKKHGFVFVGPTTMYALMQAIGLVDDHVVGCWRRGVAAGL